MLIEAANKKKKKSKKKDDFDLEQQYQLLFSKIGRDFITREELEFILKNLFEEKDILIDEAIGMAIDRAFRYKELYDANEVGDYQDLIDLSEI